jgi:hypothetical protein
MLLKRTKISQISSRLCIVVNKTKKVYTTNVKETIHYEVCVCWHELQTWGIAPMNTMKRNVIVMLIVSLVVVSGLIVAGCVQNNGSNSGLPTAGTGQPSGSAGASSQQYRGAGMLSNITFLTAAASKLGVSEQDLQNALSSSTENTTNGRPNLTAAAQQLNVTRQQLIDAFGMSASGRMRNGGYNATQT